MNLELEPWQLALEHYQAGDLARAEEYCRRSLLDNPNHAEMLQLMGIVAFHSGHDQAAKAWFTQAIAVNAENHELHHNLGMVFWKLGQLDDAASSFRQAIAKSPEFVEAHNNLGNVLKAQGEYKAAVTSYEQALRFSPNRAEILYNLANVRVELGQTESGILAYRQALHLDPDLIEAHIGLSQVLNQRGHFEDAVASYQQVLQRRPDDAEHHFGLGKLFQDQGKQLEAITAYRQAIVIFPDYPEALNNLGNVLQDHGQLADAVSAYQRALSVRPSFAEAHRNLGNTYLAQGNVESAISCYEIAASIRPGYGVATLAHQLQHRCRWDDLDRLSQQVIQSVEGDDESDVQNVIMPFCFLSLPTPTTPAQQLRCAQKHLKLLGIASTAFRPLYAKTSDRHEHRKIKLGYLSADFRDHPVSHLIAELFESHDRQHFDVFGYSIGLTDSSPFRQQIVNAFDHFRDFQRCSHLEAAKQIAADKVDILIDLQGFTQHSRTKIMAHRPAPIQVNYLGYPGTMGATFVDYILVDDYIVPNDQQCFYTERLVHLPGCYMVNDSRRPIDPRTPQRSELGLPDNGFVFCAFSSSYKITPTMFDVWLSLLRDLPESVLWLREVHPEVSFNLRRRASDRGVSQQRLIFAPTVSMPEHLARHRAADLYLDTFPYNQHSTASDALRVGLPVLTYSGETFASRVAGSLLRSVGLSELITSSFEEYRAIAIRLAQQPEVLSNVRQRLRKVLKSTSLFDGRAFAKKVEQAYRTMWETYIEDGDFHLSR